MEHSYENQKYQLCFCVDVCVPALVPSFPQNLYFFLILSGANFMVGKLMQLSILQKNVLVKLLCGVNVVYSYGNHVAGWRFVCFLKSIVGTVTPTGNRTI